MERERAISENELQNKIALAQREEQLVAQKGANQRRSVEDAAAADAIRTTAEAEREERLAQARAAARRLQGEADAGAEAARMAAIAGTPPEVLLTLALREFAGQLPNVGTLVLTPDVVTGALAKLVQP